MRCYHRLPSITLWQANDAKGLATALFPFRIAMKKLDVPALDALKTQFRNIPELRS